MTFQLGSTQVRFTFGFFALTSLFLLLDRGGMGLVVLASGLLHEIGHLVALYTAGGRAKSLTFSLCGIGLCPERLLSYPQEAALLSGGVAANFIGLVIAWIFSPKLENFFLANAAMFVFHLLPISVLDGGRLLRLTLDLWGSLGKSAVVVKIVSIAMLLPLLLVGLLLTLQKNPTLFLTSIYLLIVVQKSG